MRRPGWTPSTMKCARCMGTGWVCQIHRAMPWKGPYSCDCGAPGVPCGSCTEPKNRGVATLTSAFRIQFDIDGWRH
jgi:hypothetical protein